MSQPSEPPRYEKIAAHLRERIRVGDLQLGDALPSEPALAAQFGMNRATVRRALATLREEGLVDTQSKSGTTVSPIAAPEEVPAPDEVARQLEIETGSLVTRQRRLLLRDGKVVPLSVTYSRLRTAA